MNARDLVHEREKGLIGLAVVLVIGFGIFMFAPEIPLCGASRRS